MGTFETIIWFIVVAVFSFAAGFLAISYTYKKNSKTPKQHGFTEADEFNIRPTISAREMEEKAASIDGSNALKGFKQN